ncbi:MAG: hypothetical protein KIT07_09300 [Anaerolineales bacterium]|nr:hypothetical protein [Anaerolineales bacterium]
MNSKTILTASACVLGLAGIVLTFAPELGLGALRIPAAAASLLLAQIVGSLYFGFATLNWMLRDGIIGGIYNRPLLVANVSHFVIAALAILKQLSAAAGTALWVAGGLYALFAILFGWLLFQQPSRAA